MSTGFQVDVAGWKRQMRAIAKQWNIPVKTIMRYEMGLWGRDLVKKQWPQRKAARQALSNDLLRLFQVVDGKVKNGLPLDLAAEHDQSMDPRTGRVRKSFGRGGSELRHVVSRSDFNRHRAKMWKQIGKVKKGWLPMVERFGMTNPLAWLARSAASIKGSAVDRMGNKGNGYLEGTNSVFYAKRMDHGVLMATARTRQRDFDKHLHKRMEAVVKYANAQRG